MELKELNSKTDKLEEQVGGNISGLIISNYF
jgi:hypothetical protein